MTNTTWRKGEALSLLRETPRRSFAGIVTDPPFSSGGLHIGDRQKSTGEKYQNDGDRGLNQSFEGDQRDQRSYFAWCTLWMMEALRCTAPGGRLLCFCDWRQLPTITDAVQAAGWRWRGTLVWDKGSGARAPHSLYFKHQAEFVVWGSRSAMKVGGPGAGGPYPGVFYCPVDRDKVHQTQKPVPVMKWLLGHSEPGEKPWVPPGGVICDPFAGSASTLLAARELGIESVGFEDDDHYFEVGRARLDGSGRSPRSRARSLFGDEDG